MNLLEMSAGIEALPRIWKRFLIVGIALMLLGIAAFVLTPAATLGTVLLFGWISMVAGIFEIVHAFRVHHWTGRFLYLIAGIIGILVGLLVVTHPLAGALAWTLLFAAMFTIFGTFRVVEAILLKFPQWGWALFDGCLTILCGVILWLDWPWSGLWFLGFALGITLLFRGTSYVVLGLSLRKLVTSL